MTDGWAAALFIATLVVAWALAYRFFGDYLNRPGSDGGSHSTEG